VRIALIPTGKQSAGAGDLFIILRIILRQIVTLVVQMQGEVVEGRRLYVVATGGFLTPILMSTANMRSGKSLVTFTTTIIPLP
jgi:hypothetical protein